MKIKRRRIGIAGQSGVQHSTRSVAPNIHMSDVPHDLRSSNGYQDCF